VIPGPAGTAATGPRPVPGASTILFLLRAYPDVDHLTPLMWKCLEKGHRVLAVFWRPFSYETDYRIEFLKRYPGFQVLAPWAATSQCRVLRLAARFVWPRRRWAGLIEQHRVAACCVDWGRSILPGRGWDRLRKAARAMRGDAPFGERVGLSSRLLGPAPLRTSALEAARAQGLPTFCLPHGVLTIVEPDDGARTAAKRRVVEGPSQVDLYGRNAFSVYVYPSESQRLLDIRRNKIRPAMTATWGSLRYSAPWMRIVHEICPSWQGPRRTAGRVRLLVLVPKTSRSLDGSRFSSLVSGILDRGDVDLVLKPHPRVFAEAGGEEVRRLLGRPGVWLGIDAHTPALIDQTDAALVLVSGVTLELLIKGKPLIYPAYLHRHRLIFDEEGGCLRATSPEDVHRFLDGLARGEPSPVPQAEIDRIVETLVYAGRRSFDVPEYYYAQIQRYVKAVRGADSGPIPASG
jgi:hypothetical protein